MKDLRSLRPCGLGLAKRELSDSVWVKSDLKRRIE